MPSMFHQHQQGLTMGWIFVPLVLLAVVGLTILIIKSDKSNIRQAVELKELELIDIATTYDIFWHNFKYTVTLRAKNGNIVQEKCRVSFLLGVIWADEDSFLKWLIP